MTRDEAIERLNIHKSTNVFVDSIAEAIDMAIEALMHEIRTETHGVCLISRADAIEAVAQQWLFEASVGNPYVNDDDIGEYRKLAEELFEDVPSVEAVSREVYDKRIQADEEIIDSYRQEFQKALSADADKLVRCEDCRYRNTWDNPRLEPQYYKCGMGVKFRDYGYVREDDYCPLGKRREGGGA